MIRPAPGRARARAAEEMRDCGHADAQGELGLLYFEGKHVGQNRTQAVHWFTRAAQDGNAFAQAWLGDV